MNGLYTGLKFTGLAVRVASGLAASIGKDAEAAMARSNQEQQARRGAAEQVHCMHHWMAVLHGLIYSPAETPLWSMHMWTHCCFRNVGRPAGKTGARSDYIGVGHAGFACARASSAADQARQHGFHGDAAGGSEPPCVHAAGMGGGRPAASGGPAV